MKIEPRAKRTPFDFTHAVGAMFKTSDGKAFAWRLLFWTTAALSIVLLVSLPMILPHYAPIMEYNAANMQAIMAGQTPPPLDPEIFGAAMVKLIPGGLIYFFGFWLAYAAGEAALHQKILNNRENPKRALRFGKEQLLVILAQLGVWGSFFLVYIGGFVVIAVFMLVPVLGAIVAIFGAIAILLGIIYVPVRLAPAAALSVQRNKPHLLAARHITKNRFWPLFGAYLVTFIGGYVLIGVMMQISLIVVTGDPNFMMTMYGMGERDMAQVLQETGDRLKNPIFMLLGVLSIIAMAFSYALWLLSVAGVGAYAVKWWQDDDPIAPFD